MDENLIKLYKKYSISFCNYTVSESYTKANRMIDKLNDIRRKVKCEYNKEQIEEFYGKMLFDENIYVRYTAACYCLRIGIFIKEARKILKVISKDINIHYTIRFDAKMSLKYIEKTEDI